jgi:hypothetical protein
MSKPRASRQIEAARPQQENNETSLNASRSNRDSATGRMETSEIVDMVPPLLARIVSGEEVLE